MKNSILGVLCLALMGCGSSDSDSPAGAVNEKSGQFNGLWQNTVSNQYVYFNDGVVTEFNFDFLNACNNKPSHSFSVKNNTIELNLVNHYGVFEYKQTEDTITLTNQTDSIKLVESDTLLSSFDVDCADKQTQGILTASVELVDLPESITVNRAASGDDASDFEINVYFDVNGSGVKDKGDLSFSVIHFKSANVVEHSMKVVEMRPSLYINNTPRSRSKLNLIKAEMLDNTLHFSVERSSHKLLKNISNGTQIFVKTLYKSATGKTHSDCYPDDCEYTAGLDTQSGLNDKTEEKNAMGSVVDIKKVSIKITDE